ncbi:C40 family peptidase [Limosilactobacillus reuteri]|uniref:C40 family peptidase n=1 Tax=Limosilactobacillus reuteri TaxID=1598 RepID=UPI00104E3087|nr:C40 family peptidase [Limosilactobacillus reuteri]
MSKVLAAALGAAGALAVANTASADTQVQVQSGDTVWGFAQQYATTVDSISTANQLADPNVIYVGQQLVIPSSAISTASAAATVAAPTATDNATASQAAVETTETTAASTTPAVSTTNASNVADQAQPTTVVSASDNNTAAQVSVASQAPAQVSAASATISVAQTSAANTNNNVTTLAATTNTAAPTQTTYAATEAVATPQNNTTVQSTAAGQGNGSTANAVAVAQAQIGTPYVWGGNQPGGFDCSGLVQYAYGLGSNYRTTYQQTNLGTHQYDIQNAQSGDLYFWGPDSAPYHVAIATGNGGYIQAPTPGQNVQTGNINYYTPSFYISMN